jgi:FKBP-type peptidyl-prolyl cis-trans isomerase FkpA
MRLIPGLLFLACVSCNETPSTVNAGKAISLADSVAAYNQQVVKTEIQEIDDFIGRYHWEMSTSQTGLRCMIYVKGQGQVPRQGDIVKIKYDIHLLNGELVYHSDSASSLNVEIGKGKVVSGLEEGLMLMKKGEKAKLIVPAHLAFGLLGDLLKIPSRAALVMDVEIIEINRSKN